MGVDWITCEICKENFCDCGPYGSCGSCEVFLCDGCHQEQVEKYGNPKEGDEMIMCYGADCAVKCDLCSGAIIHDSDIIDYFLDNTGMTRDQVVNGMYKKREELSLINIERAVVQDLKETPELPPGATHCGGNCTCSEKKELTFNKYQIEALKTARPECNSLSYSGLKLAVKTNEILDTIANIEAGEEVIDDCLLPKIGALLWYISKISGHLKIDLERVAIANLEEIKDKGNDLSA